MTKMCDVHWVTRCKTRDQRRPRIRKSQEGFRCKPMIEVVKKFAADYDIPHDVNCNIPTYKTSNGILQPYLELIMYDIDYLSDGLICPASPFDYEVCPIVARVICRN